ncbi:transmembrane protein 45B-like [Mangifera indica]|uniref:transmembrane protein 45B-like n=1 Tax=Mangifera indica TaxID=29780 RepID=UPI001CFA908F|nr:transmembrane protein 45B-like [Mangifera indica]
MGSLAGHVAPGIAFVVLGLWHLLNHIKLHSLNSTSFTSSPWFPCAKIRYIELYLIMLATSISMAIELVIGPQKHHPFDTDGTIPSNHLRNFEHATISLTFFTYAAFAVILDRMSCKTQFALTQFIGAIAFAQELLLFRLHSTDHMGVEGHYHLLLQFVILVCLTTALLGIRLPKSFLIAFVRSASIFSQGLWFILTGYMLWTPEFIPKGCFIHNDDGHRVVQCHTEEALQRAKSLVNLAFSWFLVGVTVFSVSLYVVLDRIIGENKAEYATLKREDEHSDDIESQEDTKFGAFKSFYWYKKWWFCNN